MILDGITTTDATPIEALVQQYGIGFDTQDRELVLGCFTDDAHLNYLNGLRVVIGMSAIKEQMFKFGPGASTPLPGTDRIISYTHQFRVDRLRAVNDGEVAGAVSAVAHLITETGGQAQLAIRGIRYTDRYRRTGDGWRIAERHHEQLWESLAPVRQFQPAPSGP